METLIVLAFIFSVISLAITIGTLLYVRYLAHKEHDHVRKIISTIWSLKTHLQQQFLQGKKVA